MKLPDKQSVWKYFRSLREEGIRYSMLVKVVIGMGLLTLIILLFPHPESTEYSYSVGNVWVDKDLIAPFSFPIYRDAREYEKALSDAARSVYPVFIPHDEVTRTVPESLHVIYRHLEEAGAIRSRMGRTSSRGDSLAFARAAAALPPSLTPALWSRVMLWSEQEHRGGQNRLQKMEQKSVNALSAALHKGIIDQPRRQQPGARFALRRGTTEDLIPYSAVLDVEAAINEISGQLLQSLTEDEETVAVLLIRQVIRPNIRFDQLGTARDLRIAQDNVPRTSGYVEENERIVAKNDRITDEIKQKLDSFRRARADRGSHFIVWKHWLGSGLHIFLVLLLFSIYLSLFRKAIFRDNSKLIIIGLLILMVMVFAWCTLMIDVDEPVQYLIFIPAASMLLAIIFDSRVAFFGTVTIALLTAGIRGNDYSIALSSLIAGTIGAYTVRDISNRTQMFRSIIFVFTGYALSIIAMSLEQFEALPVIGMKLLFASVNAVVSPLLAYGLLLFFERIFNVTTDLTLVELADFNQPLLKMLSEKAPGTFHHSITIGNLAEAAAEAIGANAILARVGGYYHDIGKMNKPEYFVENQVGPHSRHNRLKPRMSALILSSHVREGMELGREYHLPEVVIDFIPQHHGTTRMSYFFDKALKQAAKRQSNEGISEEDFRYPGPKPQTKEAGIVMLADSVEASSRSMENLTPQLLEQVIENMIRHRFIEGQLDECELTLRDLTKTREAFLKILMGIHHQRITYPEQQQAGTAAAAEIVVPPEEPQEPAAPAGVPGSVIPEDAPGPGLPAPGNTPAPDNKPVQSDDHPGAVPPAGTPGRTP